MIHITWIIPVVVSFTLAIMGQQVDGEFQASLIAWARGFILFGMGILLGIGCECISREIKDPTR